jgi:hypothetical protein
MKILGKVFSGIACSFLPVVLLGQQVEKSDVITSMNRKPEFLIGRIYRLYQ